MEWEERKRQEKRKRITTENRQRGGGEREEGPDTFYSCSNVYLVLQSYNTASSPGSA